MTNTPWCPQKLVGVWIFIWHRNLDIFFNKIVFLLLKMIILIWFLLLQSSIPLLSLSSSRYLYYICLLRIWDQYMEHFYSLKTKSPKRHIPEPPSHLDQRKAEMCSSLWKVVPSHVSWVFCPEKLLKGTDPLYFPSLRNHPNISIIKVIIVLTLYSPSNISSYFLLTYCLPWLKFMTLKTWED